MDRVEFENELLEAIKKDDLKSFSLLMPTNADLNLCYGRFPILSLLYLYSSFNILSKYEKQLLQIHNFKVVDERNELYKTFKIKAKRTIRFFLDGEIIYPILMLAVLNERTILKHNFKFLFKNAEINDKLSKIYKIKHNLDVEINEDFVKIPNKKPNLKQSLLFVLVSIISCFVMALSGLAIVLMGNKNGLGTISQPIKISKANEFVKALDDGNRVYSLQNDLEIDASNFKNDDFSGTILGNGKTVSLVGKIDSAMTQNLKGTIKNLNVKILGGEVKISKNWAIFAENSSGKIQNCAISGDFVGEFDSSEEVFSGMFVAKNSGEISGCELKVSASLSNKQESNAYFGNFAGRNDGVIKDSKTISGIVMADTVDLAGIACQNYGEITNTENKITLNQTSNKEWHPNIGGVVIANYGKIVNSKNHAELNASSTTENETTNKYYIFIGGLACENYGEIDSCKNYGKIIAKGKMANVIAGGLVSQNIDNDEGLKGKVVSSLSKNDIDAKSETGSVCVGGLVGLNATIVTNSGFVGNIDADSTATNDGDVFASSLDKEVVVYAGGLVGISQYSEIKNCYADVNYKANGEAIVPPEENAPQKLYTGIVGTVGVFWFEDILYIGSKPTGAMTDMDKNYYVEKTEITEFAYGIYATTSSGYYVTGQLMAIGDSVITAYFGENSTAFNKVTSLPPEILLEGTYE